MSTTTREQFIAAARHLFAERGFYGVSIAAVAEALGLTKQALLHHFGNKEKLYGEVLQSISGPLQEQAQGLLDRTPEPQQQLVELVLLQYRSQSDDADSARLIMRELLDNEQRAEKAGNWYLAPYLNMLVDALLAVDGAAHLTRDQALAVIYQWLGAAHYFAVSQPTLASIFGARAYAKTEACFEDELRQLILARLQAL